MGVFDSKNFNSAVFQKYLETVPRVKQNALLKAGVLRTRNDLKGLLVDQVGGNFISVPMSGRIGGNALNYDGDTDITATSLDTYLQNMIVVGRAKAWEEKDFSFDITGHDFMEDIASQVGDYWDDIDQLTILKTLAGIFGVTTNSFTSEHTLDIALETGNSGADAYVGATTLNNAIQKAAGGNKDIFKVAIMHSQVATNLENIQVISYWKETDANGVQRPVALASWNGRTVLVDDDAPIQSGYYASTSGAAGALKVVASSPSDGQIAIATVQAADFYPAGVAANDYVVAGVKYVTYLLGDAAFDYVDCGAKVPVETHRDPTTKGGKEMLITRQRKVFAPRGFSFVQPVSPVISPSDTNLATADCWTPVVATDGSTYFPNKAFPFARILSKG